MPRGQLILIEGLDRTGKSTQVELLVQEFIKQGKKATSIKFPDRSTPIGNIINKYLTDKSFNIPDQAAHLLFLANRWELELEIVQLLNSGHFVILDRYIYSGLAYSLAKSKLSQTTSPQLADAMWLYSPDIGLPKPDITLFLDIDVDELARRSGWGEERYESVQFQTAVKGCFHELVGFGNITNNGDTTIVDVNNMLIDQVAERIWNQCTKLGKNSLVDHPIAKFDVYDPSKESD